MFASILCNHIVYILWVFQWFFCLLFILAAPTSRPLLYDPPHEIQPPSHRQSIYCSIISLPPMLLAYSLYAACLSLYIDRLIMELPWCRPLAISSSRRLTIAHMSISHTSGLITVSCHCVLSSTHHMPISYINGLWEYHDCYTSAWIIHLLSFHAAIVYMMDILLQICYKRHGYYRCGCYQQGHWLFVEAPICYSIRHGTMNLS